ncbi:hypothetical protein H0264_09480 [Nocardia huaxiensis]|uniref:Uncharacterized protein n=1 Tax=Nocardia huaxiensis TaxID=2755382 RepID=A0A7D6VGW1_9NOCA|nr:hypothetical protein [Nocardia huaxiensis]QLY32455.1 hypothetical protein H0264_09480 [Nocardia huaxiensis]
MLGNEFSMTGLHQTLADAEREAQAERGPNLAEETLRWRETVATIARALASAMASVDENSWVTTDSVDHSIQPNLWHLTDAGRRELLVRLRAGTYHLVSQEDTAIPLAVLLMEHARPQAAMRLLSSIKWEAHRFAAPAPITGAGRPLDRIAQVATLHKVSWTLSGIRDSHQILVMHTSIRVWHPMYDRLVALWCRTVEGGLPHLDESLNVHGGRPYQVLTPQWRAECARWLADFDSTRREQPLIGRHARPGGNFQRLYTALRQAMTSDGLSPREIGWVRRVLANTITRSGAPGSEARRSLRARQLRELSGHPTQLMAAILVRRLRNAADHGCTDLAMLTAPVRPGEDRVIAPGTPIPGPLLRLAARTLEAPVHELIRDGIIESPEMLAAVLPQLRTRLYAADFADPVQAGLFERCHIALTREGWVTAFDRGKSVWSPPLPVLRAFEELRTDGSNRNPYGKGASAAAWDLLRHLILVTLTGFPHQVAPDPLLAEFRALAQRARRRLPLVERIPLEKHAVYFDSTWTESAAKTVHALHDTLYQRYFDLPEPDEWAAYTHPGRRHQGPSAEDFRDLCVRRAAEAGLGGSWIARNGAVLEQAQILTAHNLAVLFEVADLRAELRHGAPTLVTRVFDAAVQPMHDIGAVWRHNFPDRHPAAEIWRVGVFLLSHCPKDAQQDEVLRLLQQLDTRHSPAEFQTAVLGLAHIVDGGRFTHGVTPDGSGRRFLGWRADGRTC